MAILLRDEERANLHNGVYVYRCVNQSLLEPYLTPFWEYAAARVPRWVSTNLKHNFFAFSRYSFPLFSLFFFKLSLLQVHPNILTLFGSLAIVPSFILYAYYSWGMTETVPVWVCATALVGIFLFQTLDNLDGKQARKLGLSSPIGDWFDHSLDILSLYLLLSQVATSSYHGHTDHPILNVFAQLAPAVMHYFCFWDRVWTRELFLGPMSMTEGQVVISVLLIAGPVLGQEGWTSKVVGNMDVGDMMCWIAAGVFTVVSPLGIIHRVITHPERKTSLFTIFLHSLDIVVAYGGAMTWAALSSVTSSNTRLMMYMCGLCVTNVTSFTLLTSLMRGPHRGFYVCTLPWVGVVNHIWGAIPEMAMVVGVFIVAASIQMFILSATLHDLRQHLSLRLFHVPREKWQ